MESVYFFNHDKVGKKATEAFMDYKSQIEKILPEADIQHVGSTAIPNSITKGDLDIQVRVRADQFSKAVEEFSKVYDLNEGSTKTKEFHAFKDDSTKPPLGIQLTVKGSEFDFFWKFRDVLLANDVYRKEYDSLKRKYEGKDMETYRAAKNEFFQKILTTSEFQSL